jgi:sec-independent protein translocase protein TatA
LNRWRIRDPQEVAVDITEKDFCNSESEREMFDSKILWIILAIAVVIFGTKRLRTMGSDFGAAIRGFRQAANGDQSEDEQKMISNDASATTRAASTSNAEATTKTKA